MHLPISIIIFNNGRILIKTRRVIITKNKIRFILPKYFGGEKIFEFFWANIQKISVRDALISEATRYIFSFKLNEKTDNFIIKTHNMYSENKTHEIINKIGELAQKKGIEFESNLRTYKL